MDAILCALDLSPASKGVVEWATLLARSQNCRLILFHAIHAPSDPWHLSAENERGATYLRNRSQIESDMARWMQSTDCAWDSQIVIGDPAETVQHYCQQHAVRWVVTGSKGFKGVKRLFLGTVVERMARMLPCPMLVIRKASNTPTEIRRIAVCCDRSIFDQRLVEYGAMLADLLNADLHLLHAMESAIDPELMDPSKAPYGQAQQELQARVKNNLLAMVSENLQSQGSVETNLCTGQAHEQLPLLFDRQPFEMLVVGLRHRRALGQWMTGSTTEAMLRKIPCHVLVIPDQSKVVHAPQSTAEHRVSSIRAQTGIVQHPVFLAHRTPQGHPENHRRLEAIYALLNAHGADLSAQIEPRRADVDDLALVHAPSYIQRIARTAEQDACQMAADTFTCAETYLAARMAAGSVLTAIDAVLKGDHRNAFVLERPPGHHAEISKASGFCLFNNVAIGARYARRVKGLRKILIIDWDLHHGNGTQHIFEEDPSVMYISSHQYPCFPGTGHYLETGRSQGQGYTINLPLGRRWRDGDFVALYQRLVTPIALAFNPDLILVSAGFDIHKKDPLGKMKVTEDGFAALTRILMNVAHRCCHDRLVLILEGGYHPKAMAASIQAVLAELREQSHADLDRLMAKAKPRRVDPIIKRCSHVVGHIWPNIGKGDPIS